MHNSVAKNGRNCSFASKDKAQILLEQFKSVFTQQDNISTLPEVKKKAKEFIPPLHITTPGTEKLLKNINTSKANGPDNISNIILKACATQIAPALSTIFQSSIDTGKLPSVWLNANVAPLFKKGMCTYLKTTDLCHLPVYPVNCSSISSASTYWTI